jgi:hypothetical protein
MSAQRQSGWLFWWSRREDHRRGATMARAISWWRMICLLLTEDKDFDDLY